MSLSREDLEDWGVKWFLGLIWFGVVFVAAVSSLIPSSTSRAISSSSHSSAAQSSQSHISIAEPTQSPLSSQSVSSSGSSSNTGAIAGGVVGGVAAIAIILSIVLWVSRKRRLRFRSVQSYAGDSGKNASETDASTRAQYVAEANGGMAGHELPVRSRNLHEADGMARHELPVNRRTTLGAELQ